MDSWAYIVTGIVGGFMSGGLLAVAIKARPEANKLNVESAQINVTVSQSLLKDVYDALDRCNKEMDDLRDEIKDLRRERNSLILEMSKKDDTITAQNVKIIKLEEQLLRAQLREERRKDDPPDYVHEEVKE